MSSRNTQRESFKTPTKPRSAKKAKKTIDYSSDSSYAGVYDISDDEDNDSDDDPDVFLGAGGPVEKYEEAAMFESAEEDDDLETVEDDTDSQRTPRANDEYEEWQGIPDSSDEVLGDGGFLENISSTHDSDTYDSPKKRVTFDLSDDSDIASDDEWWPDLFDAATSRNAPFLSTDALPPSLARRLEDDRDNDDNDSSDHEVYWGNKSSDEEQNDDESDDSSSSSGYECKWHRPDHMVEPIANKEVQLMMAVILLMMRIGEIIDLSLLNLLSVAIYPNHLRPSVYA
jgi:hypothetical protein